MPKSRANRVRAVAKRKNALAGRKVLGVSRRGKVKASSWGGRYR